MTKEIKQLSFADMEDTRPLPLIVAERWGFSLQYRIVNDVYYFSALDWIAGVGFTDVFRAEPTLKRLQSRLHITNLQYFDYVNIHNQTIQSAFGTDEQMYTIAQNMSVTKSRPALKEIQDFLSKSGAQMDEWRLHPERMLSVAQSRMLKDIERHEKAGLGDRPEIVLLKSQEESLRTIKELNSTYNQVIDAPRFAELHNTEYYELFRATAKQMKAALNNGNIRQALPQMGLDTLIFAEKQINTVLRMQGTKISNETAKHLISQAIAPLGVYLRGLSDSLGVHHITGKPLLEG